VSDDYTGAQAEGEIFTVVQQYCDDGAPIELGYPLNVFYPGVIEAAPDKTKFWGRVSTQTVLSRKVGFVADGIGGRNRNRFEVTGLLFIQLFCPRVPGTYEQMKRMADDLVTVLRSYRSPKSLTFKNSRWTGLPPEDPYFRVNVISETEFNQLD
jgi:hypothetical protein